MADKEMNKTENVQDLDLEDMGKAAGGKIARNPEGTCDTLDKYIVVNDETNQAIAKVGGYAHARKVAEGLGLSTDDIPFDQVKMP